MIAIAVAAIVVGLAVPNLSRFLDNNSATEDANEFTSALQYARSEAIKRGLSASIDAINDDWINGYDVNVIESDGTKTPIRRVASVGNTSIPNEQSSPTITSIQFASNGLLETSSPTFIFCKNTGARGTEVVIRQTGRVGSTPIETCT